jgi:hypothetical protein
MLVYEWTLDLFSPINNSKRNAKLLKYVENSMK